MKTKIAIASDDVGFARKEEIKIPHRREKHGDRVRSRHM